MFYCIYMYHILFNPVICDGHLGCFCFLAIVNNAATVWVSILSSFGYVPREGISGSYSNLGFPGGSDSKEFACSARDPGSVLGLGRSPGERNVYPLQYSWLENPRDRGARPWGRRVRHDWVTDTYVIILHLAFWGTAKLFFTVAAPSH